MEQAISRAGRHSGWSEVENKLLWETADEALKQGLPLKAVFEHIAERTGRRPNSIRNYYYAQMRQRDDGQERTQKFIPFTQEEVDWLIEQVLIAKAAGQSVRSCLQKLSGGDHSLMLRYQNKYRAIIKGRPDYVRSIVSSLREKGVECELPQVNHRHRPDMNDSCRNLISGGRSTGDAELARACEVIAQRLINMGAPDARLTDASWKLISSIKEFMARPDGERLAELNDFMDKLVGLISELESLLPETMD